MADMAFHAFVVTVSHLASHGHPVHPIDPIDPIDALDQWAFTFNPWSGDAPPFPPPSNPRSSGPGSRHGLS